MYPKELIDYITTRTAYKARQIVRRVPSLGDVEDVQHYLVEDVLRRLPKFNGNRAGVKTFVSRVIDNRIADLLTKLRIARSDRSGPSCDDWVLDDEGAWTRRDAVIDADRAGAHLGIARRSDEEQRCLEMDTASVLAALSPEQRELCVKLTTQKPTEISRETGMARSVLYQRIAALRQVFFRAGLHLYI